MVALASRLTVQAHENKKHRDRMRAQSRWVSSTWEQRALLQVRYRAKRKGMECNITAEDIRVPSHCPILGIELFQGIGRNPRVNLNSPSVDRIDNSLGYIKGNVRVISTRANSLKSDGTIEEFLAVIDYMRGLR